MSIWSGENHGNGSAVSQCGEFLRLAISDANNVGVMLGFTPHIRHARNSVGVGLPNRKTGKRQIEMLSGLPASCVAMFVVEIQPENGPVVVGQDLEVCLRAFESCTQRAFSSHVDVQCPQGSNALIDDDQCQGRDHPTPQLIPMAPARSQVQHGNDPMRNLEELIPRPANHGLQRKHKEERQKCHGHTPKNDILRADKLLIHGRLRLIQFRFNYRPTDGMQQTLRENHPPEPTVQEVEMLVGNARAQRQDTFSHAEQDGKGRQRICERSDAVGPASEGRACVVEAGVAGDGGDPVTIANADESEDGDVGEDNAENEDLEAADAAEKESHGGVGEEVTFVGLDFGYECEQRCGGCVGVRPSRGPDACDSPEEEDSQDYAPEDEGVEHGRDMVTVYVVEVFACSDIFDTGKDSRRIGPVGRICLTMVLDVLSSDQEVMVGE